MKGRILATLAGLLLLGCEPVEGAPWGAVQSPIVGGTPDSGHPAVGAILMGTDNGGLCTGTLISPKVVVTAAHCVQGDGGWPHVFVLGPDMDSGTQYAIRAYEAHPDYVADVDGTGKTSHDIAVVALSKTTTATPMPYRTTTIASLKGATITFSGFGIRSVYNPSLVGEKYKVTTTIGSIEAQGFWNYTNSSNPKNTCNGDSGGPAFYVDGGVEQIVGLVSSGDEYCSQDGWNTRVDANLDFLSDMIAKYDGTVTPPVCGNGQCETGETTANCPGDCPASTTGLWDPCDANFECPGTMVCVQEGSGGPTHCTYECGSGLAACPTLYTCYTMQGGGSVCVPSCGDGTCNPGETAANCPDDCGSAGDIWGECGTDYACPGQQFCVQLEDDSLRCTVECTLGGSDCPSGFECAELQDGGGACIESETPVAECGNGRCEDGETTGNCPADCPAVVTPECGNGQCEAGETAESCPGDCPAVVTPECGNGQCEAGETAESCPGDCPAVVTPECGNGQCEQGETVVTCPADCRVGGPVCGNGACEDGEACDTCLGDCGSCDGNPGDPNDPAHAQSLRSSGGGCSGTGGAGSPAGSALLLVFGLAGLAANRRRSRA